MAFGVRMPKIGPTMTEGTILQWCKREGEPVAKGDVLARIETDLAEAEVVAEADGCLVKVDADPEQMVACGEIIAWIGSPGEAV